MPDARPTPEPFIRNRPGGARDLRSRLRRDSLAGRRPRRPSGRSGPTSPTLRELVAYWADDFDWPAQEAALAGSPTSASASMASGSTSCTSGPPLRLGRSCLWSSATAAGLVLALRQGHPTAHRPRRARRRPRRRVRRGRARHAGLRYSDRPTGPPPDSIAVAGLWAELMGVLGLCALWRRGRGHRQPREPLPRARPCRQVVAVHRMDAACPSSPATQPTSSPRSAPGSRALRPGARPRAPTLRCTAPSPDRRLRAHRLAGRTRGVDRGEAPGVERLRRRGRTALHQGRDPHERHALLAHGHDRLVDAHVPRERRDPARAACPPGRGAVGLLALLPATSSAHPERGSSVRRTSYASPSPPAEGTSRRSRSPSSTRRSCAPSSAPTGRQRQVEGAAARRGHGWQVSHR